MQSNLEQTILRNLLTNESFTRKVLPFISPDYFEGIYRQLYLEVGKFVAKYNKLPTRETFEIALNEMDWGEEQYGQVAAIVPQLFSKEETDEEWLIDTTEKWCQDRAVFNAIMESITIIDGKHKTLTKNALPEILSKALAVTFDTNIGHDYLDAFESRYDFYHTEEARIPFDLDMLNRITKGGLPNKTLNIILAGTGVGKSLAMCHMAAANLSDGHDVLYITNEMSEERIAERIDANLLDIPIEQVDSLSKDAFSQKISRLKKHTQGKLIIKEYPTGQANSSHFRALLNELKLKKDFTPDIIYVDYLNICSSSRVKALGGSINTYSYIKAIAEELRGLAVEFNVPLVSATQTTRAGYGNSDVGLEDTSESFGLPATADLMIALISNEELDAESQIVVKQLKNRYNDPTSHKRFLVGIDRSKMRLYDINQHDQTLQDDVAVFDKSKTNERYESFSADFLIE